MSSLCLQATMVTSPSSTLNRIAVNSLPCDLKVAVNVTYYRSIEVSPLSLVVLCASVRWSHHLTLLLVLHHSFLLLLSLSLLFPEHSSSGIQEVTGHRPSNLALLLTLFFFFFFSLASSCPFFPPHFEWCLPHSHRSPTRHSRAALLWWIVYAVTHVHRLTTIIVTAIIFRASYDRLI